MGWENSSFIKFDRNGGYFTWRRQGLFDLKDVHKFRSLPSTLLFHLGKIRSRGLHMMLVSVSFAKLCINMAIIMVK
jgi:hypothetical protein